MKLVSDTVDNFLWPLCDTFGDIIFNNVTNGTGGENGGIFNLTGDAGFLRKLKNVSKTSEKL